MDLRLKMRLRLAFSLRVLLSMALAVLFRSSLVSALTSDTADSSSGLIGWKGDSFDLQSVFGVGPIQLSNEPLAYIWESFISPEEAKHIIKLAAPRMKHSRVGAKGEESEEGRTSYGMFIPRYQDPVIADIEERVAAWLQLPVVNQEGIQVLRYAEGQVYKPHMDAMGRMCTVLIYLSNTTDGGETAFPGTTDADWTDPSLRPSSLSDCASGHVAVKPQAGTALLFYSLPPGSESDESLRKVDPKSLHTGCPPVDGALKWTATIWVHFDAFRGEHFSTQFKKPLPDPEQCVNLHKSCEHWAGIGECEKSPQYMVGSSGSQGFCRLACKACTPCAVDDTACRSQQREEQGYLSNLEGELEQLFGEAS